MWPMHFAEIPGFQAKGRFCRAFLIERVPTTTERRGTGRPVRSLDKGRVCLNKWRRVPVFYAYPLTFPRANRKFYLGIPRMPWHDYTETLSVPSCPINSQLTCGNHVTNVLIATCCSFSCVHRSVVHRTRVSLVGEPLSDVNWWPTDELQPGPHDDVQYLLPCAFFR